MLICVGLTQTVYSGEDSRLIYNGSWAVSNASATAPAASKSSTFADSVSLNFSGTAVAVYGPAGNESSSVSYGVVRSTYSIIAPSLMTFPDVG